jgi:ubiquinone biosynthesis protein UbiJ
MTTQTNRLVTKGTLFSEKAVTYLSVNAGKMSAVSIAKVLRRTEKSIRRKAQKLGISLAVTK